MRRRILLAMVGVTAVAVLLFGVPLGIAAGHLYRSREVSRLEREATAIEGRVPPTGPGAPGQIELPPQIADLQLAIYDARGVRVAGVGPRRGGRDVTAALAGRVGESRQGAWLAVATPLHDEDNVVGAARAAAPWSNVSERQRATWLAMIGFGFLALIVAAVLAQRQASRLSAPIEHVVAAAERLGHGDFSARLEEFGIPEMDRAAQALNATAGRLGDRLAKERAFSADASHQLSTPLTSLRLGLESALVTPGADQRGAIVEAVEEVDRLQRTIATLLSLARDSAQPDASCDAAAVCRSAAARWELPLEREGRVLRREIDAGVVLAGFPEDPLQEILQVLLDNAATHGGGDVVIRARRAGTGVVVEVEDSGPGVARDADMLFARRSPDAGGHGIGLALAKSLAEVNGGRLRLTRAAPCPMFTVAMPPIGDRAARPR